ncbi:MAG: hypothetical protein HOP10_09930 [Chitinophagaceae bacterium]|nr:hypothetical protein [Chitinophagaceae bacterium]
MTVKIFVVVFLLPLSRMQAQSLWDNINLASVEAKVLGNINTEKQNDRLIIQTFDTKEGKITVYLPPLSPGAVVSGTVYLEPGGRLSKDSSRNLTVLQSYHLSLGELNIPLQRGSFQLQLPATSGNGTTVLQLKNSTGETVKTGQLSITNAYIVKNSFTIPPYAVSGDAATITGSFDGNISNTSVMINGEKTELLAESTSQLFFKSPEKFTGKVTIECKEKGTTQTSPVNILKLDLTADKTNLRRGEKTLVHIKISGLEGLEEKIPVTITNTSPSVITLEGGNTHQITIVPKTDAPSGIFEITRNIQSLKNGSFSVSVTINPYSAAVNSK